MCSRAPVVSRLAGRGRITHLCQLVLTGASLAALFSVGRLWQQNTLTGYARGGDDSFRDAAPSARIAGHLPAPALGRDVWNGLRALNTSRIVSPYAGRYLVLPTRPLPAAGVYMACIVHSSADHFALRMRVRNTWGGGVASLRESSPPCCDVLVFVLGLPAGGNTTSAWGVITREAREHGDILLGDFRDTYANLRLKARLGVHYVTEHLAAAVYVLKADDDMFVHTLNVVGYLRGAERQPQPFIACKVWPHSHVFRDRKSKLYVSKATYPNDFYPKFCSGSAYIISRGVAPLLDEHLNYVTNLSVDDVTVTGIARADATGIDLVDIGKKYLIYNATRAIGAKVPLDQLYFAHRLDSDLYYRSWYAVNQYDSAPSQPNSTKPINRFASK